MTKTTQSSTLTDTQRQLLASAALQPDGAVVLPERRGRGTANAARALLTKALVREIRAKADAPVWRQDEATGRRFSLVLTKAGRAVATEAAAATTEVPQAELQGAAAAYGAASTTTEGDAGSAATPRSGTKLAEVIALLRREAGSSVTELMAVTGWLPHTTRAAMTGLRKRGYAVTREAGDTGSVYRIEAAASAAAA